MAISAFDNNSTWTEVQTHYRRESDDALLVRPVEEAHPPLPDGDEAASNIQSISLPTLIIRKVMHSHSPFH